MKFVTRYSGATRHAFSQEGEISKTRQSEQDACDINKIMERFNRTGQLPTIQRVPPRYGEAIAMDFAEAQNLITQARDAFMSLPASTRKHFANDPGLYMDAIQNATPETIPELKKLGILVERKETDSDVLRTIAKNTKKDEIKPGNSTPT